MANDINMPDVAAEIVEQQRHGRQKYGRGPDDLTHDDAQAMEDWLRFITDHLERARRAAPMERREHLVKVAGLCKSVVEAFDRTVRWWDKATESRPAPLADCPNCHGDGMDDGSACQVCQ